MEGEFRMNDDEHIGHLIHVRRDGSMYCETCEEEIE
jgi:hypothetical protein